MAGSLLTAAPAASMAARTAGPSTPAPGVSEWMQIVAAVTATGSPSSDATVPVVTRLRTRSATASGVA